MKKTLFNILNLGGMSAILRAQKKNKLTVLSLHRISDEKDFFWNPMTPIHFEKLLQYLIRHYSIISFSDLATLPANNKSPKAYLILSFDDGYYDFYEHALPLLVKYKLPSNHNIVIACATNNQVIWTQRLNTLFNHCRDNNLRSLAFSDNGIVLNLAFFKDNWMHFYLHVYKHLLQVPWNQRLELITQKEAVFSIATQARMMNWNEIIECSRNRVEIGCHTYNHDVLSTITDKSILYHEIADSKREIEAHLNKKIDILALPNGQGNEHIYEIAEKEAINHILFVADRINTLGKYADQNTVKDSYRINLVQESIPEMILRTELFHSKLRKNA